MDLVGMAKMLETFGPWGICVLLVAGIVYLYRSTNKLLERRNEQFIEALTTTTTAMQQNADESRRTQQILERTERVLERVERILDRRP